MTIQELNRKIDRLFSEAEVKDLCFELDIDYDNLPGETKKDMVRELILYCERHGRLEDLVKVCASKRPNESWSISATRRNAGLFSRGVDSEGQSLLGDNPLPIIAAIVVIGAIILLIAGFILMPRFLQETAMTNQLATEEAKSIAISLTQTREQLSLIQQDEEEQILDTPTVTQTPAGEVIETPSSEDIEAPMATSTPTETPTSTPEPTVTHTPKPTATGTPNSLAEAPLDAPPESSYMGDSWQREIDGMTMVYVPAGTFDMGNSTGMPDESPVHEVWLSGFWVDQTEVTNGQFARFLNEAGNQQIVMDSTDASDALAAQFAADLQSGKEAGTWLQIGDGDEHIEISAEGDFVAETGFEDHPVIEVSWYGAHAYCEWVGGKLPTEAQWEYAARGRDEFEFPWGNSFDAYALNCWSVIGGVNPPDCLDTYNRTSPVGEFSPGDSWVGAQDMAGNVFEWTNDWYSADYYETVGDAVTNPQGPESGIFKVTRGGSWDMSQSDVRATERTAGRSNPRSADASYPHRTNDDTGFRCVIDLR